VIEVRFHGRGGQGTVVASEVLATAFFSIGRYVQAFPTFGVERRGAPVGAFLRVSTEAILLRCQIEHPDHVLVLDPTLIGSVDVMAGIKPGGSLLINSHRPPCSFLEVIPEGISVTTLDAATIAVRHGLGTGTNPIVNTAILGAFARFTGLIPLEAVCSAIRDRIHILGEENVLAASEAFESLENIPQGEVVR
jgi:2-oxoacid:acceptor oxidoreductase gamma subunit (pyruvate/2-ketoisovalerate family)